MLIYHLASLKSLPNILKNGLTTTKSGNLSDQNIANTDELIDQYCPEHLIQAGASRKFNLYAYMPVSQGYVIDIVDGETKPISNIETKNDQVIIELQVDASRCFVSNLDKYDLIRQAIESEESHQKLRELIDSYWREVINLSSYKPNQFPRPEILITYSIPPSHINVVRGKEKV